MNAAIEESIYVRQESTEERTPSSTIADRPSLSPRVELGGTFLSQDSNSDIPILMHTPVDECSGNDSLDSNEDLPSLDMIQCSRLGKQFKNIKELDSGGFGTVYTGTHVIDSTTYALKMVDASEENVVQEAVCMSNLSHTNVVRYHNSEIIEFLCGDCNESYNNSNNIEDDNDDLNILNESYNNSNNKGDDEEEEEEDDDDDDGIIFGDGTQTPGNSSNEDENLFQHSAQSFDTNSSSVSLNQPVKKVLVIHMELCGGTLGEWLDQKKITDDLMLKFSFDIIEGLLFIHDEGYMHRDLKPKNIFIDNKHGLVAKIGDFGSSRKALQSVSQSGDHSNATSKMTNYIGTLPYCAPELSTGIYDKRVDLYSFGFILFEIWYKRLHGKTVREKSDTFKQIRSKDVMLPEDFQGPVRDIVSSLLQHNAEDRMELQNIRKKLLNGLSNGAEFPEAVGDARYSRKVLHNLVGIARVQPIEENQVYTQDQKFKGKPEENLLKIQMRNLQLQEDNFKLQHDQYTRNKDQFTPEQNKKISQNFEQQKSNLVEQRRSIGGDNAQNDLAPEDSESHYTDIHIVSKKKEGRILYHPQSTD